MHRFDPSRLSEWLSHHQFTRVEAFGLKFGAIALLIVVVSVVVSIKMLIQHLWRRRQDERARRASINESRETPNE
ncbi:hypothetical protein HNP46_005789 [Pseudomonas nitritireducens]|uniref:Uncharacterized protein n=1 Tax=Pseudomonas nitroreducens TaxID=46680 RepID=A0A7W7KQ78_PSENT|nr:hypothetical protein [Pseudomonas nitritireducens]MBB4866882.1 hypothetical protein [Pseudomonas nitritireducens]